MHAWFNKQKSDHNLALLIDFMETKTLSNNPEETKRITASKWARVYPVKDRKAETVTHCLLNVVWKHGVLAKIIHERAAEFLLDVLQETAHLIGLSQLPTSGGHSQTDGLVE